MTNEPTEVPKSFLHGYSKLELIAIVTTTLEKARDRHQAARKWEAKCRSLEAELEALKGAQGLR